MTVLDSALYRNDLQRVLKGVDLGELRDKTVLITGGLGLICSAVVDLLLVANESLGLRVGIFLAARSYEKFEKRYKRFNNITFVNYDATQDVDFNFHVDYIIHGASLASPEKYTTEPVETMMSNINGMKNLLVYAKREKANRVLYISSSEVYGKKETSNPFIEGVYGSIDIDSLRASYAISKQAAELLCKAFYAEYGVNTVIVRPGHIFGPTASPLDKRVSSDFAYKAAKKETLILKSSGMQKRSYCYSIDTAAAILTVLLKGKNSEAYNIGAGEAVSIKEMAEIYANAGGVSLEYQEPSAMEKQAFNPMDNSSLDCTKIDRLRFHAEFSVKEGLEHTVCILQEIIKE